MLALFLVLTLPVDLVPASAFAEGGLPEVELEEGVTYCDNGDGTATIKVYQTPVTTESTEESSAHLTDAGETYVNTDGTVNIEFAKEYNVGESIAAVGTETTEIRFFPEPAPVKEESPAEKDLLLTTAFLFAEAPAPQEEAGGEDSAEVDTVDTTNEAASEIREPETVDETKDTEYTETETIIEGKTDDEAAVDEEPSDNESAVSDGLSENEATVSEEVPDSEATVGEEPSENEATVSEEVPNSEATVSEQPSDNEAAVSEETSYDEAVVDEGTSAGEESVSEEAAEVSVEKQDESQLETVEAVAQDGGMYYSGAFNSKTDIFLEPTSGGVKESVVLNEYTTDTYSHSSTKSPL